MARHRQGRHPPIAWTASIAGSRRDSMVFQGRFEPQVNLFRHSAAGKKTQTSEEEEDYNNGNTRAWQNTEDMWREGWLGCDRNREGYLLCLCFSLLGVPGGWRQWNNATYFIFQVQTVRKWRIVFLYDLQLVWQYVDSEGDCFSLFFSLLKAFLFQREWSCDDKWGLPKLTGNSQVILFAFQRENTTLKDRQNHSPSTTSRHAWNIYERFISVRFAEVIICTYICWDINYL